MARCQGMDCGLHSMTDLNAGLCLCGIDPLKGLAHERTIGFWTSFNINNLAWNTCTQYSELIYRSYRKCSFQIYIRSFMVLNSCERGWLALFIPRVLRTFKKDGNKSTKHRFWVLLQSLYGLKFKLLYNLL